MPEGPRQTPIPFSNKIHLWRVEGYDKQRKEDSSKTELTVLWPIPTVFTHSQTTKHTNNQDTDNRSWMLQEHKIQCMRKERTQPRSKSQCQYWLPEPWNTKRQTTNSKSLQKRKRQPNWEISKTQAQLHLSAHCTDSSPPHQAFDLEKPQGPWSDAYMLPSSYLKGDTEATFLKNSGEDFHGGYQVSNQAPGFEVSLSCTHVSPFSF